MKLELFKNEELQREDTVLPLIEKMNRMASLHDFEGADVVLKEICYELKKPETSIHLISMTQTVRDVYNLLKRNIIRLNPDDYDFKVFLKLVIKVWERRGELQGAMYSNVERQRRVVAEEMDRLGITIKPKQKGSRRKMPNNRFLEICYEVNPSISRAELHRRAQVRLYLGMKDKNPEKIEDGRERLRKFSNQVD